MSDAHMLAEFVLRRPVMFLDLLMALKANSAGSSRRSRCLLRYACVGFRFVRYQFSPWFVLAIAPFRLLFASGVERIHQQVRYFRAIARIDFVRVYELLNDLRW